MTTRTLHFGPYRFEADHLDKVLFPESGITKVDLIDYYRDQAERMLPLMRDRPVTMHRFPDGIEGDGFYQKEVPDHFPDWIERVTVDKREGGQTTYLLCHNAATLAFIAEQGTITPHIWLSRVDRAERPDRLIFDLDPPNGHFDLVRTGAQALRALLEDELELATYVMTTGSRGLHVVVPVRREADFDATRRFARDAANLLARRHPDRYTIETRKAKRGERLFLDYLRNSYAQTAVTPYAVRARPGAPVATPIPWAEVDDPALDPQRYTLENVRQHVAEAGDPWAGIGRHARGLAAPRERLDALLSKDV